MPRHEYWLTRAWDWIDARDIDKHVISLAIFYGTTEVLAWGMKFAEKYDGLNGLDLAAIIAAVLAPYMALQAAAVAFYFKARN